jgi:hypothetical protein
MKKIDLKGILVGLAVVSIMSAIPMFTAYGQGAKASAKAFLNKLPDATPVTDTENKVGMLIESITRSGGDYIVSYKCTNNMIWGSPKNRQFLMTQVYFIDPENIENNYQPFTRKADGTASVTFKSGDAIEYPIRRIAFEPPSKVMYMYFVGIGSDGPQELRTVPLFFTLVLGDKPYVYEKTPRHAKGLFKSVEQ